MLEPILIGHGREISQYPIEAWRRHLDEALRNSSPRLAFMTREHHLVRDTVVTELPQTEKPLSPRRISNKTGLPSMRLRSILDELEARLFFLVRNEKGHVSWAFPVTSDRTPHRLRFSTGESIYAA